MADNPKPRREHTIKVRVSDEELEALRERCTSNELAPWMRSIALGEVPASKPKATGDPEMVRQVRAIGRNLNQVAFKLNSGEWTGGDAVDVMAALNEIERHAYFIAYGKDRDAS